MLGLPYIAEVNDCFQLARKYFEPFGIQIRDYAFPSDFWYYEDDMYGRLFEREGFYSVDIDSWKPQLGDVLLVAGSVQVSFPTHLGILVEDNKVYHHYTGRFSALDDFKGVWRRPLLVLRHPNLNHEGNDPKIVDVTELMPDHVRTRFNRPPKDQV